MAKQAIKGMRAFTSHERRRIRARLIVKYGAVCQICLALGKTEHESKIDMDILYEDMSFSIDHILALADGGENKEHNMWPAHRGCNRQKGSIKDTNQAKRVRKLSEPYSRLAYSSVSK